MILVEQAEKWLVVQDTPFEDEAALHSLLASNPDLLPLVQSGLAAKPVRFFVSEVRLSSGNVDLIGFSEDGLLTLVECKLAENDEVRRQVVGQILDYASDLHGKRYEDLQEMCQEQSEGDLAERICQRAGDPDLDAHSVRSRISRCLRDGTFRLVIVADGIRPSLRRIVKFLEPFGQLRSSVYLLELKRYAYPGGHIVVPELHGSPAETLFRDEKKLNKWSEMLRNVRESIDDQLPHHMTWYPSAKKVGKWGAGLYIQADPKPGSGGIKVVLWAGPEGSEFYVCLYRPGGNSEVLESRLSAITERPTVIDEEGIWSEIQTRPQLEAPGDTAQFSEDLISLFRSLCEEFGRTP